MIDLLKSKAFEIALKHANIIETELKSSMTIFNCPPEDLILEYHGKTKIKISIRATEFEMTNGFYYMDGEIKNET